MDIKKDLIELAKKWAAIKEGTRFTLRIPAELVEKIDQDRAKKVGFTSRNQWILEAIAHYLENDKPEAIGTPTPDHALFVWEKRHEYKYDKNGNCVGKNENQN